MIDNIPYRSIIEDTMRKFKIGDTVICNESQEIEQPMIIEGYNLWYDSATPVYLVKGKHKKKGNELTINLSEGILQKFDGTLP